MSGETPPRLIFGNLDAESEMSGRGPLKARVLQRIAPLATLMRAFAQDEDLLALPMDPRGPAGSSGGLASEPRSGLVIPPVAGLASPTVVAARSLPVADGVGRFSEVLPWAWTGTARRLLGASASSRGSSSRAPATDTEPVHRAVWRFSPADPELVRCLHDRRFATRIAAESGAALPGATWVETVGNVDAGLHRVRDAGFDRCVLKAPLSASGRDRLAATVSDLADPSFQGRVASFLASHGGAVLEPLCDRIADYGVCAFSTVDGVDLRSIHRLDNDARDGRFLGASLAADPTRPLGLSETDRDLLVRTTTFVGDRLQAAGYSGPFGVDAFSYRLGATVVMHTLCEINVRLTMGWVLAALAERLGLPGARLVLGGPNEVMEGVLMVSSPVVSAWLGPADPAGTGPTISGSTTM